jgi:membrane protein DedA with SNARE-associated domain
MLFVIAMLRGNLTYWVGRAAEAGANRTRARRLIGSPGFRRAAGLLNRWGPPVVTISFLTVGLQTLINLAAGVSRMPLRRYLPAVSIGALIWAFVYATVGAFTLTAWVALYRLSPVAAVAVVVVLLAALAAFVVRQVRTGRSAGTGADHSLHEADRDDIGARG